MPPPRSQNVSIASTCSGVCTRLELLARRGGRLLRLEARASRAPRAAPRSPRSGACSRGASPSRARARAGGGGRCPCPHGYRTGALGAEPETATGRRAAYDVAVIGAGAAGLHVAIEAAERGARACIVSRKPLAESASYWAQGGLAAALAPDDSPERHAEDTLNAGRGLCRPVGGRGAGARGARRGRGADRARRPSSTASPTRRPGARAWRAGTAPGGSSTPGAPRPGARSPAGSPSSPPRTSASTSSRAPRRWRSPSDGGRCAGLVTDRGIDPRPRHGARHRRRRGALVADDEPVGGGRRRRRPRPRRGRRARRPRALPVPPHRARRCRAASATARSSPRRCAARARRSSTRAGGGSPTSSPRATR